MVSLGDLIDECIKPALQQFVDSLACDFCVVVSRIHLQAICQVPQ
jgi:hypothetical protein